MTSTFEVLIQYKAGQPLRSKQIRCHIEGLACDIAASSSHQSDVRRVNVYRVEGTRRTFLYSYVRGKVENKKELTP